MKKIILQILILIIPLGHIECQKKGKYFGNQFYKLQPVKVSNENLLLPQVFCIEANSHYFTALDSPHSKLYVFDHQLSLIVKYGNKGKGPKEFLWPDQLFMDDSITYVWDYLKKTVFYYSNDGQYISDVKLKASSSLCKFSKVNNRFYFHSMGEFPVSCYNIDGSLYNSFGSFYPPFNTTHEKYRNNMNWHLVPYENGIVAVNAHHANIIYFDSKGNVLREKTIKKLEKFFTEHISYSIKHSKISNTTKSAVLNISTVSVDEDRLFLLLTKAPDAGFDEVLINTIVVINLKDFTVEFTLRLPGEFYTGLAVNNHKCVTFNHNKAQMELFLIPDDIYK